MYAGKYAILGMDKKIHTVYNEINDYYSITADGKYINEWIDFRDASSSMNESDDDFINIKSEEIMNRLTLEANERMNKSGITYEEALEKINKGTIEVDLENPIAICDDEKIKHIIVRTLRKDVFAYLMYFKEKDMYWIPQTYPIGHTGHPYRHLVDMTSFIRQEMIPFFDAGEFEFLDSEILSKIKEVALMDLDEKRKAYL